MSTGETRGSQSAISFNVVKKKWGNIEPKTRQGIKGRHRRSNTRNTGKSGFSINNHNSNTETRKHPIETFQILTWQKMININKKSINFKKK